MSGQQASLHSACQSLVAKLAMYWARGACCMCDVCILCACCTCELHGCTPPMLTETQHGHFAFAVLVAWRSRRSTLIRFLAPMMFLLLALVMQAALDASLAAEGRYRPIKTGIRQDITSIPDCNSDLYIHKRQCTTLIFTPNTSSVVQVRRLLWAPSHSLTRQQLCHCRQWGPLQVCCKQGSAVYAPCMLRHASSCTWTESCMCMRICMHVHACHDCTTWT